MNPAENVFISNKSEYKDVKTFQLIGEGIYHFDREAYTTAIQAFDAVLKSDPGNIVALYNKANCFFEQNKFTDALDIYKRILDPSTETSRIDWSWTLPQKENINRTLCTKMELIKELMTRVLFNVIVVVIA